jgi:polyhydroxyalkanoate synthesis regulator phasin
MDTGWVVTLASSGGGIATYAAKKVLDHLAGRGKLKVDEATQIRIELRGEIERKDREISALEQRKDKEIAGLAHRVASLEEDLEKAEDERDARVMELERYKLDVYRTLVEAGANKDLIDAVLAIQKR